jgi:hypothetical protein
MVLLLAISTETGYKEIYRYKIVIEQEGGRQGVDR